MLIMTWCYMESRLSFDFDECSSCQTRHLTKSRTFCWGLSDVTKPLSGQCCDRRWHMKGIPPHGFPRTMEHGLEVVCASVRACMRVHECKNLQDWIHQRWKLYCCMLLFGLLNFLKVWILFIPLWVNKQFLFLLLCLFYGCTLYF